MGWLSRLLKTDDINMMNPLVNQYCNTDADITKQMYKDMINREYGLRRDIYKLQEEYKTGGIKMKEIKIKTVVYNGPSNLLAHTILDQTVKFMRSKENQEVKKTDGNVKIDKVNLDVLPNADFQVSLDQIVYIEEQTPELTLANPGLMFKINCCPKHTYYCDRYKDISFPTYEKAENVLDKLTVIGELHGVITVSDLYYLSGLPYDIADTKYGWKSLNGVHVVSAFPKPGYWITLPKAMLL